MARGDEMHRQHIAANLALAAVQGLPWRDEFADERYQAVSRTLRMGGNCHDRSPVLVALLHRLGVATAHNVWMNQDGASRNHVLVEAALDGVTCSAGVCQRDWCWAETTVNGARICEDPYDAARRTAAQNHGLGPKVPADVRAPAPTGASVVTSITVPQAKLPIARPPLMAVGMHRARTSQSPVSPVARDNTPVATMPPSAGCACAGPPGFVDAMKRAADARNRGNPRASGDLSSDPCRAAWLAYSDARAAVASQVLTFPDTGSYALRMNGGGAAPNPVGAGTGFTCAQWQAQGNRFAALTMALNDWLHMRGIDPARIDGGARYQWTNVAVLSVDRQCESSSYALQLVLDAYRTCRARGGVDAAAVVQLFGNACSSWPSIGLDVQRSIVRGYLAGAGYNIALPDSTVDAMSASVTRYCATQASRTKMVATAPKGIVFLR